MRLLRPVLLGVFVINGGCGDKGNGGSPSSPSRSSTTTTTAAATTTTTTAAPANLAGNWTYRQQAPASCALPTQHRTVTFPATLTAAGGNVYYMNLSGTDSSSFSYFSLIGSSYTGNILYSRTAGSEFSVFRMNNAPFTVSANSITTNAAAEYQNVGSTLFDCIGTFTVTLNR